MEGVTIASLLADVGAFFSAAVGWVGDVADVITSNPLLLIFTLTPLIGIAVGLFRRMLNVN